MRASKKENGMVIDAKNMNYQTLDRLVKDSAERDIVIENVMGQRYIAAGAKGKNIKINGIPGNALGAYLNDCMIEVNGNGQDALGDTMNAGTIVIHGNCGDTAGYGMRDGRIFVRGYAGYRVGIHMKEYGEHIPAIVVGGAAGAYLGEYQAGGVIVVLGIGSEDRQCVGDFTATGMHGGKIYVRSRFVPVDLPAWVETHKVTDKSELEPLVRDFCSYFPYDADVLLSHDYFVIAPTVSKIYKTMYCNRPV